MFRALCDHQEVKFVLYSIGYHHTCRWPSGAQVERGRPPTVCDDTQCCINFDLLMMSAQCSKYVEAYNKLIIKQELVH